MNNHTEKAKIWLDRRFSKEIDGHYYSHQPLYGINSPYQEPNAILRFMRTYRLLQILGGLEFNSFLDVGGGEGYISALAKELFSVTAHTTDLSEEACLRAGEIFDLQGIATDATQLPFQDESYDLVLCSEVIEHLSSPVFVISELVRVAQKYVVITTAEFCPLGEFERMMRLFILDDSYPHAERNYFTYDDFRVLLGDEILCSSQMSDLGGKLFQQFANKELNQIQIKKIILDLTKTGKLDQNHIGVIVVASKPGIKINSDPTDAHQWDEDKGNKILDMLLEPRLRDNPSRRMARGFDTTLLDKLACPTCKNALLYRGDSLLCPQCNISYLVRDGVPLIYPVSDGRVLTSTTSESVIAILSRGDLSRAAPIRSVLKKLHGNRPLHFSRIVRSASRLVLRAFWFIARPESIGKKVGRLIRLVTKKQLESENYGLFLD